jgi:hypothetical protein
VATTEGGVALDTSEKREWTEGAVKDLLSKLKRDGLAYFARKEAVDRAWPMDRIDNLCIELGGEVLGRPELDLSGAGSIGDPVVGEVVVDWLRSKSIPFDPAPPVRAAAEKAILDHARIQAKELVTIRSPLG